MDGKPIAQQFRDDILQVVDKYRNQGIMVGEAVGALYLVLTQIATEEDEDEEEI